MPVYPCFIPFCWFPTHVEPTLSFPTLSERRWSRSRSMALTWPGSGWDATLTGIVYVGLGSIQNICDDKYLNIYTWIFHPCRFLDPGLRAWNFSTKNPFQHLTQILDPGNFGWFVILTLGGGFMYIPQIENNPVPIAPALRCHMDQTTSRGGRISVPQIINIYNI